MDDDSGNSGDDDERGEYNERELDRLVVYTGMQENLPNTAYRRATLVEALRKGFGVGQLKAIERIQTRILQVGDMDEQDRVLRLIYRDAVALRRDLVRFLQLANLPINSPRHPDALPERRLARHHAVFGALNSTEFAFRRSAFRGSVASLVARIRDRQIAGMALVRLASALKIPVYRDISFVIDNLW